MLRQQMRLKWPSKAGRERTCIVHAGDGAGARYCNTPEATAGLVEGKPGFVGGIHDLNYDRCALGRVQ